MGFIRFLQLLEYGCFAWLAAIVLGTQETLKDVAVPITAALSINIINRTVINLARQKYFQNQLKQTEQTLEQFCSAFSQLNNQTQSLPSNFQSLSNRLHSVEDSVQALPPSLKIIELSEIKEHTQLNQEQIVNLQQNFTGIPELKLELDKLKKGVQKQSRESKKSFRDIFQVVDELQEKTEHLIKQSNHRPEQKAIESLSAELASLTKQFKNLDLSLEQLPIFSGLNQAITEVRKELDDSSLENSSNLVTKEEYNQQKTNLSTQIKQYFEKYISEINQLFSTIAPDYNNEIIFDRESSRKVLIETLQTAEKRLILVCPWLSSGIDNELISLCKNFIKRGGVLEIGWGNSRDVQQLKQNKKLSDSALIVRQDLKEFFKNDKWRYSSLPRLEELEREYPHQFKIKLIGTHEKYLVSDRCFAMLGSHNFLTSIKSEEREVGLKTNDPKIISDLIERFETAQNLEIEEVIEDNCRTREEIEDNVSASDYVDENNFIDAKTYPVKINICGVEHHKWKNVRWKGQIMPIKIVYSERPDYKGRHEVKIYNKLLGIVPKDHEQKLPVGCSAFMALNTDISATGKIYVKGKVVDKPLKYQFPFAENSYECFSDKFIYALHNQSQGTSSDIYFFEEECHPIQFYEWLLRMKIDEEIVDESVVIQYLSFRDWLIEIHQFSEEDYGDEDTEKYKEYCNQEKESAEAEEAFSRWEFGQDRLSQEYSEGAWVDEHGTVFNDDGEWIGME